MYGLIIYGKVYFNNGLARYKSVPYLNAFPIKENK